MKRKVWQELKEVGKEEIKARLQETENKLFQLKFRKRTSGLKNPLEIRVIRRDIARMKTLLRQKHEIGVAKK